uniref:Proteasomal ubiquitin receptor ADRM1 homolog n=1 Tax=Corethrella appendiculata TaxID=1370023 RepID=U5EZU3_9DIPT
MSGPIFSSNIGGSSNGNRHLVEFRAGRMNLVNKMVHPDTRKGLVYVYQAEDGLIHFCWKDRTTGNVEDDLIVFPDDCEFKKIENNVKSGRVYLLKFKSSSRRLFFWMQEPKTDKDDEWCRRINEVINNPPSNNSLGRGGSAGGNSGSDSGDLQYMLNNMSQQQLMQLFGGVGQMGGLSNLLGSMNRPTSGNSSSRTSAASPRTTIVTTTASTGTVSTPVASNAPTTPRAPRKTNDSTTNSTTPAATTNTSDASRVLLSELQNYLAGITPATTGGTQNGASNRRQIDLSTALNSESLTSILSDPKCVSDLEIHLPEIEGDSNKKQQLKETLSSPQFQQALSMFSSALQSGQLGPVISQFQLSSEAVAAANTGDLEQFVKALEKEIDKQKQGAESTEKDSSSETAQTTKSTATAATTSTTAVTTTAAETSEENNGHQKDQKTEDDEMLE